MKIGYQLYSARADAERDLKGTFLAIKHMGYDGVELAGLYGKTPDEFRQVLREAGVDAVSAHVPLKDICADMFKTISDYKYIGCRYIAVPYTDAECRPGGPRFAETLFAFSRFGRLCREAGMHLLYHNHDFEFEKLSGIYGLDFIYAAVDARLIQTEIDTCWVRYAGEDPSAYVRKYAGRAPIVHLKDFVGTKGDKSPYALIGMADDVARDPNAFEFRPVGYGCQNFVDITDAARAAGAEWVIVEQDDSTARTPLEDAKLSIEYLKSIGL